MKRFLPFAAGPRSCPGRPLAEVSAIAGACLKLHVCSNYLLKAWHCKGEKV